MFCPKCGARTSVVQTRPYPDHTMRRLECQGCGNRFTSTETALGAVVRNPNQIREPASAVGFVCACLDRADNPGQVVRFVHALLSAASDLALRDQALRADSLLCKAKTLLPEMEQCASAASVSG